jgi:DNA polymerase III sliding clamp (beta) subunit (PCNA family)
LVADEMNAVTFTIHDGVIDVAASSQVHGAATEQVAVSYTGPDLKICAGGTYVLDFLNATDGGTVVIELNDAAAPMMFSCGAAYQCVIMPIRL